jgi:hypothetical protein
MVGPISLCSTSGEHLYFDCCAGYNTSMHSIDQLIPVSVCDVRTDDLTRQLYSTDASIYQIEPIGVAFPARPCRRPQ